VEAVGRLPQLCRSEIRNEFERRFTARRMAEEYVSIYQRLIDEHAGLSLPEQVACD
jgi:hypothetical protein